MPLYEIILWGIVLIIGTFIAVNQVLSVFGVDINF